MSKSCIHQAVTIVMDTTTPRYCKKGGVNTTEGANVGYCKCFLGTTQFCFSVGQGLNVLRGFNQSRL